MHATGLCRKEVVFHARAHVQHLLRLKRFALTAMQQQRGNPRKRPLPPSGGGADLLDSILGDGTLFARDDEVAEAWRIVDSIIAGWEQSDRPPATYTAGTWGPPEADALLRRGRTWRRP